MRRCRWHEAVLLVGVWLGTGCPVDPPSDTDVPADTASDTASDTDEIVEVDGRLLYNRNCSTCHGVQGGGTQAGPSLIEQVPLLDVSDLQTIIRDGTGTMPGFDDDALSDDDVDAIIDHVLSQWGS